ncbi:hypothetical protein BpHYR1_037056 [Brachionus plicatilis]|uniref:Uncharacterized protein n=1 Tax=Brachionus plicatilis TaxID=10195 RepID=A0A3M7PJD2_BRAPC|nr:hypothetical protein BpHYR1_037056 [Brachionus plicatilis]
MMTTNELMDTDQNEAIIENKSHPSLKLSKFMNSTPALNTPPPESIDFYHEISLSDISLNRLEHIVEDTGFQEDTALTPLIHSPPQSATSVERKNFYKLNSDFISKHSLFKLRLQRSFSRFNRLKLDYLRGKPTENSGHESENELADDDSLLSSSKQDSLNQSESAKLVHIKNQLKNLSNENTKEMKYFGTNVIESKCECDSMTSSQEMCVFCGLSKPNKVPKRTLKSIYFDHPYIKFPMLHSSNDPVDDLHLLNCVYDDTFNKMVNERLDKLFNSVDHFPKQSDSLPNLTTEE